jgi:hypothetical protein
VNLIASGLGPSATVAMRTALVRSATRSPEIGKLVKNSERGLLPPTPAVRKVILNLILAGFVLGSTYDIVTNQEHWPFSQYPMFAGVWTSPTFTWLRVFGVTADGREFPLDANSYIAPFDQSRLPKALRRMLERSDGESRVTTALRDLMSRYEILRRSGAHEGPPVVGLRLYEVEYTIDRQAANVDRPDHRRFIAEVMGP